MKLENKLLKWFNGNVHFYLGLPPIEDSRELLEKSKIFKISNTGDLIYRDHSFGKDLSLSNRDTLGLDPGNHAKKLGLDRYGDKSLILDIPLNLVYDDNSEEFKIFCSSLSQKIPDYIISKKITTCDGGVILQRGVVDSNIENIAQIKYMPDFDEDLGRILF